MSIAQFHAVQGKKDQHDMSAGPFVPIHKGMVAHKTETEPGGLRLQGRIGRFPVKGLERGGQGRFQQPFVPNPLRSAELPYQVGMQGEDLLFRQVPHFASSS